MKMKRIWMSSLAFGSVLALNLTACGTASEETSNPSITNGRVIENTEFPSVVLLYDAKMGGICTGTFVSDDTVISAGHCTMSGKIDAEGNVAGKLLLINARNIQAGDVEVLAESVSAVRNPLWDKNGKNVNKFDLSVIKFPKGTAKAVSPLATVKPKVNDQFVIVGFGLNQSKALWDSSTAGVKRVGANFVQAVTGGFIQFKGLSSTTTADGTESSASSGDSGGPLFINGKLAGITSGGAADWFGFGSKSTSLYIDLSSPESKAFLAKNLKIN